MIRTDHTPGEMKSDPTIHTPQKIRTTTPHRRRTEHASKDLPRLHRNSPSHDQRSRTYIIHRQTGTHHQKYSQSRQTYTHPEIQLPAGTTTEHRIQPRQLIYQPQRRLIPSHASTYHKERNSHRRQPPSEGRHGTPIGSEHIGSEHAHSPSGAAHPHPYLCMLRPSEIRPSETDRRMDGQIERHS